MHETIIGLVLAPGVVTPAYEHVLILESEEPHATHPKAPPSDDVTLAIVDL